MFPKQHSPWLPTSSWLWIRDYLRGILVVIHMLWTTLISCLNTHPFKYASWLSAQFFWQKSGFIFLLFDHVMHSRLLRMHDVLRLTFNVSLLKFSWNSSNVRRNSSYICPASVWITKQSNRSEDGVVYSSKAFEVGRTFRCNKCFHSLNFVINRWFFSFHSHRFHNFVNVLHHNNTILFVVCVIERYLLARRVRLARLWNDFTSLGFGQVGCPMFHLFPVVIHRIRMSRNRYE